MSFYGMASFCRWKHYSGNLCVCKKDDGSASLKHCFNFYHESLYIYNTIDASATNLQLYENAFGDIAKCDETPTWHLNQQPMEMQPAQMQIAGWRHQMETLSALLAIYAGNSPVPGEFPTQRPVTQSFDVSFDLRLNKRLCKQSWGWWRHRAHYDVTVMCAKWKWPKSQKSIE